MLTESQINKWINSYQIFVKLYPEDDKDRDVIEHVCCNGWGLGDDIPCPFCDKKSTYHFFEMDPQENTFRCSKENKHVTTIEFVMRFLKYSREEAIAWVNGIINE